MFDMLGCAAKINVLTVLREVMFAVLGEISI